MGWGQFSSDNLVDLFLCFGPVFILQVEQNVGMGKAMFLELNDPKEGQVSTKDGTLGKVIHGLVLLELENPSHQVRAKTRCDFWPLRVSCHSDQQVRLV